MAALDEVLVVVVERRRRATHDRRSSASLGSSSATSVDGPRSVDGVGDVDRRPSSRTTSWAIADASAATHAARSTLGRRARRVSRAAASDLVDRHGVERPGRLASVDAVAAELARRRSPPRERAPGHSRSSTSSSGRPVSQASNCPSAASLVSGSRSSIDPQASARRSPRPTAKRVRRPPWPPP